MKFSEITQKTKKELQRILIEQKERLRILRFNLSAGKVKNVKEVRGVKKDIARILTLLNKEESVIKK